MDTNAAHPAPARFEHFLQTLQTLLDKAARQKNPALWLYRNNARTALFMLEGLSRLHAELHNKKRFSKMKEHFKLLEDGLGAIDYYDAMATQLAANKKVPAAVVKYLKAQAAAKVSALNGLLKDEGWLGSGNRRMGKIRKKLADADWMEAGTEVGAIKNHYMAEIAEVSEFVQDTRFHFDNMEEDVHELRRKIRWLSIYPQALLGTVQLVDSKPKAKHLAQYLTKAIITSPFNKMPPAVKGRPVLQLEKNYFLALSWTIAELGNLKDLGLRILALKEALEHTEKLDEAGALKKAHQLLGSKAPSLLALLDTAESIAKHFFAEQYLQQLIKGTATQP
jgi:hypothetical protein